LSRQKVSTCPDRPVVVIDPVFRSDDDSQGDAMAIR
jgi:hypothetical protein